MPPPKEKRDATLVFHTGDRVSGFDGCNSLTGGYTLTATAGLRSDRRPRPRGVSGQPGDGARFSCGAQERQPLEDRRQPAGTVRRRRGTCGGICERLSTSPPAANVLQGTRWQLVVFQGSDGTKLTPDDRGKYTIEFDAGGRLNRGLTAIAAAYLEVERAAARVRSAGTDSSHVPAGIAPRSDRQAMDLHPLVHDEGRTPLPRAHG